MHINLYYSDCKQPVALSPFPWDSQVMTDDLELRAKNKPFLKLLFAFVLGTGSHHISRLSWNSLSRVDSDWPEAQRSSYLLSTVASWSILSQPQEKKHSDSKCVSASGYKL